jgi:hypothetical protein
MSNAYWDATDELEEMSNAIIANRKPELVDAKIVYTFREKTPKKGDKIDLVKLGTLSKVSPKDQYLFGNAHYRLVIGKDGWMVFSNKEKEAFLYHLLCYADVSIDEETNEYVYKIKKPDIQEFTEVVSNYGLWNESLRDFGITIKRVKIKDLVFEDIEESKVTEEIEDTESEEVEDTESVDTKEE